jgi:hypothetical protein
LFKSLTLQLIEHQTYRAIHGMEHPGIGAALRIGNVLERRHVLGCGLQRRMYRIERQVEEPWRCGMAAEELLHLGITGRRRFLRQEARAAQPSDPTDP